MPSLSLTSRIVGLVLLASLAISAAVLMAARAALYERFEATLVAQQVDATKVLADEVDAALRLRTHALEAATTASSNGDRLHSNDVIADLLKRDRTLRLLFPDGVTVMDAQATVIAENTFVAGRVGTNYGDRHHVREALTHNRTVLSRPIIGRRTGRPILSIVTPIRARDGTLLGLLNGLIIIGQTPLLSQTTLQFQRSEDTDLRVIDQNNQVYVDRIGSSGEILPLPKPGQDPFVDAALLQESSGLFRDATGKEWLYGRTDLPHLGWTCMRAIDHDRALQPAEQAFRRFVLFCAIILVIVLLTGTLVTRWALRPLIRTTERIRLMAAQPGGDSEQLLPEQGPEEVRQLHQAFNQLSRERTAVDQMKDSFVANVSHELRTPLTAIYGSLRLIASGMIGPVPPSIQEMVDMATRNVARLQRLVNDILDLNKLRAGNLILHPECIDVQSLAEDAAQQMTPVAAQRQIRITIATVEVTQAWADPGRLRQVIDNYLSNAIRHSPDGATVTLQILLPSPDRVRLLVKDQGDGVPEHFKDQVFTRFTQADQGNTRRTGGTGLGLAICRELAHAMQGDVGFANDRGALFWIDVPARAPFDIMRTPES